MAAPRAAETGRHGDPETAEKRPPTIPKNRAAEALPDRARQPRKQPLQRAGENATRTVKAQVDIGDESARGSGGALANARTDIANEHGT